MEHAWLMLLATPMWLKLGVALLVGLAFAFPAIATFLLRTEAGRAVLLGTAAIVAICLFRADAFADGRAVERAAHRQAVMAANLKAAKAELRASTIAREAEQKHGARMLALAAQHTKELTDATTSRDRTIADLRTGAVRLRDHWTCPNATAAAADPGRADDAAELREEGAADLVRLLDEADADIRYWQGVAAEDRRLLGQPVTQ